MSVPQEPGLLGALEYQTATSRCSRAAGGLQVDRCAVLVRMVAAARQTAGGAVTDPVRVRGLTGQEG